MSAPALWREESKRQRQSLRYVVGPHASHWMEPKRRYNRAPRNAAKCRSEGAIAQPKLQLQFAHSADEDLRMIPVAVLTAASGKGHGGTLQQRKEVWGEKEVSGVRKRA